MSTDNPRRIDRADRFGLQTYPFRFQQHGPAMLLEALVKLLLFPGLLTGPVMFIAMFVNLVLLPGPHAGGILAACWLVAYATAVWFLWTWREERFYDRTGERFCVRKRLLGHWRGQCWDAGIFSAISVGYKRGGGRQVGAFPVVRLHARTEDFLLDAFLDTNSLEQARELGARLAAVSGLALLEERNTGPQDDLNDIRNNAWLIRRQTGAATNALPR